MYADRNDSKSELTPESIEELEKLFTQVPPSLLRDAVIKVYLRYATSEEADLSQDIEGIDKPIQTLLTSLEKLAGDK
jgi:hypothetical protein